MACKPFSFPLSNLQVCMADLQVDSVLLQVDPFIQRQLLKRDIITCQGLDFGQAGGGEVILELEDNETGAPAMLQLQLFRLQGILGVKSGLPRRIHLLQIRLDRLHVIIDRRDNRLLDFFGLQ